MILHGKVLKYGDDVDTDVIIPGRYCHMSDPKELGKHALEDLDKTFVARVRPGDILVAGENFGCGSSREVAPVAIRAAGIACVVAKSFARIFFRNAINIGLPIFESKAAVDGTDEGDLLRLDGEAGTIANETKGKSYEVPPFPREIQEIIKRGGLVPFVRARLGKS